MDILETVFSIGVLILIIISICVKRRKLSIFIQGSSCALQLIYDLLIGAMTAAIAEVVDVVRSALFIYKDKFGRAVYLAMLIVFELFIVGSCIFTWAGPISLLPTIGAMVRTYAAWQPRMGLIRIAGVVTGALYVPYFVYYNSPAMAVGYGILLLVGIYEVIQHRDLQGGDGCSPDDKPIKEQWCKYLKLRVERQS